MTSIIDSIAQDPHSYELTARDRLAIESADLVVVNGGGYDGFVSVVLDAMDEAPVTIDAVALAGLPAANEHVWYDLGAVEAVADEIAAQLAELDPGNSEMFRANAAEFGEGIGAIEARIEELRAAAEGLGVVVTEPVPGYLLAAAGFVDVTPDGFSEAIEEGADVAPAVLAGVLATIASGRAAIVVNNPQTGGPETERVLEAADEAGIPVVDVTETLPDGLTYLSWMTQNVEALAAALP